VPSEAEILRRGAEAFAELGYDGASVRELAKRLGVSHNFINDRYGSKGQFWRAVIDAALAQEMTARQAMGASDDVELLRAVVTHFYVQAARHPYLNRIMVDEFARDTDRQEYLYERYVVPTLAIVEPSVQRLIAAGKLVPIPMHLLYFAVIGPVAGVSQTAFARRLGRPATDDPSTAARALAEVVVNGLLPNNPAPSSTPDTA
jgi:AcrR family transcriptional regulator